MESYTRFFEAVRELERRMERDAAIPPLTLVAPERMQQQLRDELPLLPLVPPEIPTDPYLSDLGEYRALLARFQPALAPELEEQERRLAEAPSDLRTRLVQALLHGRNEEVWELTTALGVAPERLYFLGELALRPWLQAYAERLESVIDFSAYRAGRCPVCGRQAHMGRIDPDNVKHLHCPACEATWRFHRVGCSGCGCTDPEQLGFFTVEGDEERRVEYCKACGHYLKVLNQRVRVRAVDLLVEDAATAYLDELAVREGYVKGGRRELARS